MREWRDGTATKYDYMTEVLGVEPAVGISTLCAYTSKGTFPA
jgi:hypothetical protein